mmetsp:Transcript_793/g.891  ORF Transcript_793/g.891 Transcript_793/m.891 type:complete len:87 (+) Transcript_793:711-971(+)
MNNPRLSNKYLFSDGHTFVNAGLTNEPGDVVVKSPQIIITTIRNEVQKIPNKLHKDSTDNGKKESKKSTVTIMPFNKPFCNDENKM